LWMFGVANCKSKKQSPLNSRTINSLSLYTINFFIYMGIDVVPNILVPIPKHNKKPNSGLKIGNWRCFLWTRRLWRSSFMHICEEVCNWRSQVYMGLTCYYASSSLIS
jgi:hypothetical protein